MINVRTLNNLMADGGGFDGIRNPRSKIQRHVNKVGYFLISSHNNTRVWLHFFLADCCWGISFAFTTRVFCMLQTIQSRSRYGKHSTDYDISEFNEKSH